MGRRETINPSLSWKCDGRTSYRTRSYGPKQDKESASSKLGRENCDDTRETRANSRPDTPTGLGFVRPGQEKKGYTKKDRYLEEEADVIRKTWFDTKSTKSNRVR